MLNYKVGKMFNYLLVLFVLFLVYITVHYNSKKSMFFDKLENEINFISDFPEIKPDRCLTSNPYLDGDKNSDTIS